MSRTSLPRVPHPVLDRIRSLTGWSDRQIGGVLGMAEKGIYDSRKTGATPYRHIINAVRAGHFQCDLHWLFTGEDRQC